MHTDRSLGKQCCLHVSILCESRYSQKESTDRIVQRKETVRILGVLRIYFCHCNASSNNTGVRLHFMLLHYLIEYTCFSYRFKCTLTIPLQMYIGIENYISYNLMNERVVRVDTIFCSGSRLPYQCTN